MTQTSTAADDSLAASPDRLHSLTNIKLVVFDLDGTLIDAFEDIAQAANHIRDRNGLPSLSVDDVKQHVGYGARRLIEGILPPCSRAMIDENHRCLVEYYSQNPGKKTKLYPGAFDLLRQLRERGIDVAIASNKPHPVTCQVVELMGLSPFVNHVRGDTDGLSRKPAPDMLNGIMADARCEAQHTVMVGDTEVDLQFARNAGVAAISVTYGQRSREYLQPLQPDFIIDSLGELLALIAVAS